eukprot:gene17001-biopygen4829
MPRILLGLRHIAKVTDRSLCYETFDGIDFVPLGQDEVKCHQRIRGIIDALPRVNDASNSSPIPGSAKGFHCYETFDFMTEQQPFKANTLTARLPPGQIRIDEYSDPSTSRPGCDCATRSTSQSVAHGGAPPEA